MRSAVKPVWNRWANSRVPVTTARISAPVTCDPRGMAADVALVAEGTDFGAATMEAGKAFFKITVFGEIVYTPWFRREPGIQSPNVFVRTARLIGALEDWARDYENRNVLHTPQGTVEPKVQISALRGCQPYYVTKGVETCMLYLAVWLTPDQDPRQPRDELRALFELTGLQGEVELFYTDGATGPGICSRPWKPWAGSMKRWLERSCRRPGLDFPACGGTTTRSMRRTFRRSHTDPPGAVPFTGTTCTAQHWSMD